jgi:hypothetical protein
LDRLHELAKDPKLFPEFNQDVVADLRTSLDLFLDDIAWGETPDFRQFLLSDGVYLNGRLSKLYGGDLPADAPFQKVPLGPDKRAGVLTHPLLMAGFADHANGSPIHRGVFIARGLLGRRLRPPPDAVTPMSPDLHPEMSTRERVALQTKSQACLSCHTMINPLGFALENFDAVGRWRAQEKGRPVDASGAYESPSGDLIKFTGSKALAETLAKSEETHAAFIEHLFHALVKQPVMAYGIQRPERLRQAFVKNEFNVRKLMADIVVTSAMKGKNP